MPKFNPPKKTFVQIKNEWETLQCFEMQKKMKSMRTIAHDIEVSYDLNTITSEQLLFYIEILGKIGQIRSFPQPVSKLRSKLLADWFVLTGHDNPEIISKINGDIMGGSTGIDIGDPVFSKEYQNSWFDDQLILNYINQGKIFRIDTTGDGLRKVQLRVIDASEPILTYKEMQSVKDSGEMGIIQIPTGTVNIASSGELEEGNVDNIKLAIIPGNYKIGVYHRGTTLYIVLCKVEQEAKNNLSHIYCFSEY